MSKEERLREKFLLYAKYLEKTNIALAEKIRKRIDELVSWYMEKQRDMTFEEFKKILNV